MFIQLFKNVGTNALSKIWEFFSPRNRENVVCAWVWVGVSTLLIAFFIYKIIFNILNKYFRCFKPIIC